MACIHCSYLIAMLSVGCRYEETENLGRYHCVWLYDIIRYLYSVSSVKKYILK